MHWWLFSYTLVKKKKNYCLNGKKKIAKIRTSSDNHIEKILGGVEKIDIFLDMIKILEIPNESNKKIKETGLKWTPPTPYSVIYLLQRFRCMGIYV